MDYWQKASVIIAFLALLRLFIKDIIDYAQYINNRRKGKKKDTKNSRKVRSVK